MPPAVAAAGVAAAGSLGGALIGRSGQSQALKAQERAANQQIQLERERDAARGARYSQAMDDYRQQRTQYDATRRALLAHYGINMGGGAPAGPAGPGPGDAQASGGGMSLGQLMGSAQRFGEPAGAAAPPAAAQLGPQGPQGPEGPQPMGAEGDTFDWRNYGVR